jgi:hypothetical protein
MRYQEGLEKMKTQSGAEVEKVKTVLAFNLARAYEEKGEIENDVKWYRDVLKQHPEHMECKFYPFTSSPSPSSSFFSLFFLYKENTAKGNSKSPPSSNLNNPKSKRRSPQLP